MARRILWAPIARETLLQQFAHIARDNPDNARLVRNRLDAAITLLAEMPIGRPGRVFGTYEKTVPRTSLIIAYELPDAQTLGILRVVHSARNWPEGEWPEE